MKPRFAARFVAIVGFASTLASAQPPVFEVASIRPASPPTPETIRSGQVHLGAKIEGARLDFGYTSLWDLIAYAFRAKEYQIVRPEWTRDSRWNILANLPAGTSKEQAPDMMRSLLVDRFKLTSHRDKREQQVYQLVVAAGGPKVPVSTGGDHKIWDGSFPGFGFGGLLRGDTVISGRIIDQPNCGMRWEFVPLPMSSFADALTMFLDKPVLDETNLKGNYEVTLDINAETMAAMNQNMMRGRGLPGPGGGGGGRSGGDGKQGPPPGGGPAQGLAQCLDAAREFEGSTGMLFKAVQKLGLNLQSTKAPIDTIVVDHLEKTPTEN